MDDYKSLLLALETTLKSNLSMVKSIKESASSNNEIELVIYYVIKELNEMTKDILDNNISIKS